MTPLVLKGLKSVCWRKPGFKFIILSTITPTGAVSRTVKKCVIRRTHHPLFLVIFSCILYESTRAEIEVTFPQRSVTFPGLSEQPSTLLTNLVKLCFGQHIYNAMISMAPAAANKRNESSRLVQLNICAPICNALNFNEHRAALSFRYPWTEQWWAGAV